MDGNCPACGRRCGGTCHTTHEVKKYHHPDTNSYIKALEKENAELKAEKWRETSKYNEELMNSYRILNDELREKLEKMLEALDKDVVEV